MENAARPSSIVNKEVQPYNVGEPLMLSTTTITVLIAISIVVIILVKVKMDRSRPDL